MAEWSHTVKQSHSCSSQFYYKAKNKQTKTSHIRKRICAAKFQTNNSWDDPKPNMHACTHAYLLYAGLCQACYTPPAPPTTTTTTSLSSCVDVLMEWFWCLLIFTAEPVKNERKISLQNQRGCESGVWWDRGKKGWREGCVFLHMVVSARWGPDYVFNQH